jgi:hypothetical protein
MKSSVMETPLRSLHRRAQKRTVGRSQVNAA